MNLHITEKCTSLLNGNLSTKTIFVWIIAFWGCPHLLIGQGDTIKSVKNYLEAECKICTLKKIENKALKNDTEHIDLLFHQLHIQFYNNDQESVSKTILELKKQWKKSNKRSNYLYLYYFIKGVQLYELELYNEAITTFKKSLQHHKDAKFKSYIWYNIATAYRKLSKFDEGLEYLEKAEKLFVQYQSENNLRTVYQAQADIYIHLNRFKEAEIFYQELVKTEIKLKDSIALISTYTNLANLYYAQYLDNQATPLFKKALALAKEVGSLPQLKDAHENMYIVYENATNYKKAFGELKNYQMLSDSINNAERVRGLSNQEKKHLEEQKNAEISILEKDKLLIQQQRNFSIFSALAILAILFLIGYQYQSSLKKNKIIATQKQEVEQLNTIKDELLSVLGHDLRSPMQHLISVFDRSFKVLKKGDEQQLYRLLQHGNLAVSKTSILLDNVLQWVTQQNQQGYFKKEMVALFPLIQQIQATFLPITQMQKIELVNQVPEDIDVLGDRNSLKIIIRNLVDNAIKFTPENGQVVISATTDSEGQQAIHIQDTGVGMSSEVIANLLTSSAATTDVSGRKSTGLGLRICKDFIRRHDGELQIEGEVGKGSRFSILLPAG